MGTTQMTAHQNVNWRNISAVLQNANEQLKIPDVNTALTNTRSVLHMLKLPVGKPCRAGDIRIDEEVDFVTKRIEGLQYGLHRRDNDAIEQASAIVNDVSRRLDAIKHAVELYKINNQTETAAPAKTTLHGFDALKEYYNRPNPPPKTDPKVVEQKNKEPEKVEPKDPTPDPYDPKIIYGLDPKNYKEYFFQKHLPDLMKIIQSYDAIKATMKKTNEQKPYWLQRLPIGLYYFQHSNEKRLVGRNIEDAGITYHPIGYGEERGYGFILENQMILSVHRTKLESSPQEMERIVNLMVGTLETKYNYDWVDVTKGKPFHSGTVSESYFWLMPKSQLTKLKAFTWNEIRFPWDGGLPSGTGGKPDAVPLEQHQGLKAAREKLLTDIEQQPEFLELTKRKMALEDSLAQIKAKDVGLKENIKHFKERLDGRDRVLVEYNEAKTRIPTLEKNLTEANKAHVLANKHVQSLHEKRRKAENMEERNEIEKEIKLQSASAAEIGREIEDIKKELVRYSGVLTRYASRIKGEEINLEGISKELADLYEEQKVQNRLAKAVREKLHEVEKLIEEYRVKALKNAARNA